MNEGAAYGPAIGADSGIAELARLADELIDEIGAARRHYDDLRAVLDGQVPEAAGEDGALQAREPDPVLAAPPQPAKTNFDGVAVNRRRTRRGAEGARLIALNMALSDTPRHETARYLEQNFELEDQDSLLDEVYARLDGATADGAGRAT